MFNKNKVNMYRTFLLSTIVYVIIILNYNLLELLISVHNCTGYITFLIIIKRFLSHNDILRPSIDISTALLVAFIRLLSI